MTSGTITDAMIQESLNEQDGEPMHDDRQFQIEDSPNLSSPRTRWTVLDAGAAAALNDCRPNGSAGSRPTDCRGRWSRSGSA